MRRYRLALLAAAAIGLGATQFAAAADLPPRVAPRYVEAPPVFSWTGFYLGVHGGAGWGNIESSADIGAALAGVGVPGVGFVLPTSSHGINGFLAGGQVGYNWQAGPFVYGIEGNISWADIEGNTPCLLLFNCNTKINWMADVSGRLGIVPTQNLLVYVKGGVAWADSDYSFGNTISVNGVNVLTVNGSVSDTRIGGLLGMGAEYAFWNNWSAKIEYNYMDFGTETYNFAVTGQGPNCCPVTFDVPVEIKQQIHTMKLGVNYKF
jgi:outer membrane immunogenic protein